ncbi:MAG: protein-L-isoaspartate(D-aspartate) O-methyltransferase [Pseudohongiellaceae bacterium]
MVVSKDTRKHIEYNKVDFLNLLRQRGIEDSGVLDAMNEVPREEFVGLDLMEFAYDDSPLPIGEGQTISQPYIVALMTETLRLQPGDKVLEVGTGSGYAAAVLSRLAGEVYTIERHQALTHQAAARFRRLRYGNIEVMCGDGTLGWPENAPYDAIVVAAGGPEAPRSLLEQLAIGGRLVIPTGNSLREQGLMRITRTSEDQVEMEELGRVRFVPLIGEQGWDEVEGELRPKLKAFRVRKPEPVSEQIERAAVHIPTIESVELSGLLERVGEARVVLIGEASHGTAEFYDMRARITRELIQHKGFHFVAAEADWPDAAQIDHFARGTRLDPTEEVTFSRFPTWMWANVQVLEFVKWLRHHNRKYASPEDGVGFYGLDLYSLYASIHSVINYLEAVDTEAAAIARRRYGCLSPWESDPSTYGAAALTGAHQGCEEEVIKILDDLLVKRIEYAQRDGRRFLDAVSNARLIKNAEEYYRVMYHGSSSSWNLRDKHMFDTFNNVLSFHGPRAKGIIWAHNSHIGDAAATEMSHRGDLNIGHLCRSRFGDEAYLIGFGTHEGTVAAASDWGAPMEVKTVRPSLQGSYERLCHDSGLNAFLLPLRHQKEKLREQLRPQRMERAIGVIYRPETELASHYFNACLPRQFDEYIWFDQSRAIDPLGLEPGKSVPGTFPFGL